MSNSFTTNLGVKVGKIITEVRAVPNLDFYSKMTSAAQSVYEDYFTNWEAQFNSIKLWDPKKGLILLIKHNRWSLIWEFPDSIEEYETLAKEIMPTLVENMGCKDLARYGQRFQCFVSRKMSADEQAKLFHLQNRSSLLQNLSCFKDKVTDDAIFINTLEDGFKMHYESGPMGERELMERLKLEQKKDLDLGLPELALWCDIDTSILNLPSDRLKEVISTTIQKNTKNVDEILTFLCAKE